MSKDFKFTYIGQHKEYFPPVPAKKVLPEWYKNLDEYIGGERNVQNGHANTTGKKCMPMFDIMTSGYVFRLQADIWIEINEDGSVNYNWPSGDGAIHFHNQQQLETYPSRPTNSHIPKILNPYLIETPKGYSTLFIPPANHDCSIQVFSGIVDTDSYIDSINFPFVPKVGFKGLIKAGTPFVQMIPIKREKWTHSSNPQHLMQDRRDNQTKIIRTNFFKAYRDNFWFKKDYS